MAGFGRSNSLSINTGGGLLYVYDPFMPCGYCSAVTMAAALFTRKTLV